MRENAPPNSSRSVPPPDFYLACQGSVTGWGGGLTFARGLAEALRSFDQTATLLGQADQFRAMPAGEVVGEAQDLRSNVPPWLWRVRTWCLTAGLTRSLGRLAPPRRAFVSVSPAWVVAARRCWPGLPVVYVFPCLMANCLPFTWAPGEPGWWGRVNFVGVRRTERAAFAAADLVLSPTQQSLAEIRAFAPGCAERLVRCDFGVWPPATSDELRSTHRASLGIGDGDFAALAVGVCDRNKGFDLAIRAWTRVAAPGRLVIVGDGPERDRLRELAAESGLTGRVLLAGPQRDMAPWYAAADAVLSTSRYDTFPNVLLEGLAAGRAILVPQHDPPRVYSGLAEVLRSDEIGLTYDRGQVESLAAAVNHLIYSAAARQRMGAAGRRLASERLVWTTAARRILELCGLRPADPSPGSDATPAVRTRKAESVGLVTG